MEEQLLTEIGRLTESHWWFRGRRRILETVIADVVGQGAYVLDVGCGHGTGLLHLFSGCLTVGADISRVALEKGRELGLENCVCGRVEALPFRDGSFDTVLLLDVLEHVEADWIALREIYRVLAPGGVVYLTVPAFSFLWGDHDIMSHHRRRYTTKWLQRLALGVGFESIRASYFNIFFFFPVLFRRLLSRMRRRIAPLARWKSDIRRVPRFANELFTQLFAAERFILKFVDMPFGVSILSILTKPRIRE